jgi:predicted nucleic acid-binding protein
MDLYLLALANQHAGRLATFDQEISISAVRVAKVESLGVI